MNEEEVEKYFVNILEKEPNVSIAIAAIRTLMQIIERSSATTVQGLQKQLSDGIDVMKSTDNLTASITSACDLFMCFISFVLSDISDFEDCKKVMLDRGNAILKTFSSARSKVAVKAAELVTEKSRILTHSRSRAVLEALKNAADKNVNFEVFVTLSSPDNSGRQMCEDLKSYGIKCTQILSEAVYYIMEQIDFVMLGAEAVVESGGIINKIGSVMFAQCAKSMNKPVFVLAESFKFLRTFPLDQRSIPNDYKYKSRTQKDFEEEHPLVDYTPPQFIDLLYTDLGILTPAAICDQLMQLYL